MRRDTPHILYSLIFFLCYQSSGKFFLNYFKKQIYKSNHRHKGNDFKDLAAEKNDMITITYFECLFE